MARGQGAILLLSWFKLYKGKKGGARGRARTLSMDSVVSKRTLSPGTKLNHGEYRGKGSKVKAMKVK